ncbi:unnamed protein product [Arctia plantaginis]|uniref:Transposable element P transposase-like GTP-binding insertion domain-containing protein n=1 Tax=Arctia plantaginis TaxID=874455 RepID=A0A8S0YRG2_ARCPL|nr:unnamed protein product [Arctia plantaginis]
MRVKLAAQVLSHSVAAGIFSKIAKGDMPTGAVATGASVENPYIEVKTSDNKQGIGIAKWSHIRQFYELDNNNPNFVYAPHLTKEHLDPNTKQKMRVKLAAQVLSHSVAAGIFSKIAKGDMPTGAVATGKDKKKIFIA